MADIKFSQFTLQTDYNNVQELVGYDGVTNVRISPNDLISSWNGENSTIRFQNNIVGTTSIIEVGAPSHTATDFNLVTSGTAGYLINSLKGLFYNGTSWNIADSGLVVEPSTATIGRNLFIIGNGTGNVTVDLKCSATGTSEIGMAGLQFAKFNTTTNLFEIGLNQEISWDPAGTTGLQFNGIPNVFNTEVQFLDNIADKNGSTGLNDSMLVTLPGAGNGVFWKNPADNQFIGYKSLQTFVWTNGNPVAYTNWINGLGSTLPFNPVPQIQVGTYLGLGPSTDYAWTCVNTAGGTAGQQATFTLGANGAGTWKIKTCQHWFDQTNQVEIRVAFGVLGTTFDVIDEKSTELTGDKIFYGELIKTLGGGDTLTVLVEFASGGINPFPSDSGNRPIEITFERVV